MVRKYFDEDLALKEWASRPSEQRLNYDWRGVIAQRGIGLPRVKVRLEEGNREVNLEEIAEIIGNALTALHVFQNKNDTFSTANQSFVARIASEVLEAIAARWQGESSVTLSQRTMRSMIEETLVENKSYDIAKSLLIQGSAAATPPNYTASAAALEGSLRLIRRNGQVVPWDQNKIEIAVRKAFLSLHLDSTSSVKIAEAVTRRAQQLGLAFIDIEYTQDLVQEELMRQGHYSVAEAYILYRAHRTRLREASIPVEEALTQQESLVVIKNNRDETFFWDGSDLRKRIDFALIGLDLCLTKEQIEAELRRSIYAEMTLRNLQKTIILNAKALIERDADFAKFAGRILLTYIYEEVLNWQLVRDDATSLKEKHTKSFRAYLERGVQIERLHPKLLEYNLEKLAKTLDPSADLDFDYLGIQTLYDRYLIVDKTQKEHVRLETPQFFWMRVAMGVCWSETDKEERAIALYNLYKSRRYASSTPTLFNAGTLHPQLSSCYLYKVDDSIESIMYRGIAENAFLSKWAGGLGGSWTAVRGMGSHIRGTNGESKGIVPFLKLFNDLLEAVDQGGGKRNGAGCSFVEVWHSDILAFQELRRNTGDERRRTHNMNTANWVPDLFMKRMANREEWTLFHSHEVPDLHELYGKAFEAKYVHYEQLAREGKIFGQTMPALELWKKMLSMLYETGHPWITFKDACNIRSPQDHVGVIHSSNLCTEITLNTGPEETAVCNLGSIVLDNHLMPDGSLDHVKLRETIRIAVRALDNVIDINFYPTQAAHTANKRHRPVGLGVMGLQNALYQKRIPFASEAAIEFNDTFMEAIAYYAYEASSDLAVERGTYESYKGSKWSRGLLPQDTLDLLADERGIPIDVPRSGQMDWAPLRNKIQKQGMRNSNVIAIAPTATIANIMGTTPCIEPAYKNLYVKSNLSGDFIQLNPFLVKDLKQLGLWSQALLDQLKYFDGELTHIESIPPELKELYVTAFDVGYDCLLKAAARRQKWIDQSQSTNLFLREPDMKTLSHMYRLAWLLGLKTTYYLRTLGASNIEKATVSIKKETRGIIAQTISDATEPKSSTLAEQQACSLEALLNGGTCEACQ